MDVILAEAPNVPSGTEVDPMAILAAYEAQVVPFATADTATRTRVHARGVAAAVSHEGLKEQHKRARGARAVTVRPDGDGMAVLVAILPEILVRTIHDRLTTMAKDSVQARPKGQRRPRTSALAKIRAERDRARAKNEPAAPEEPADLEDTFASQFEATPPWESVPCDTNGDATDAVDAELSRAAAAELPETAGLPAAEADVDRPAPHHRPQRNRTRLHPRHRAGHDPRDHARRHR